MFHRIGAALVNLDRLYLATLRKGQDESLNCITLYFVPSVRQGEGTDLRFATRQDALDAFEGLAAACTREGPRP